MNRQPHRLTVHGNNPPAVLSFWTATAAVIARNAAEYERNGQLEQARRAWAVAREATPADPFTKAYCDEHAQETTA